MKCRHLGSFGTGFSLGTLPVLRNPIDQLREGRQVDLDTGSIRIDGDPRDQAKECVGLRPFGE